MPQDPAFRDARAARDRLAQAEDAAEELRIAYYQAIRRVHATGASMREIAEVLGLSHQRVHQIVNGGGDMPISTRKKTLLRRLMGRDSEGCDQGHEFSGQHLDRLSTDARDAMSFAEDEARALKHDYLGTEHVLLGLIRAEGGLAARILTGVGADLEDTRGAIQRVLGRSESGGSGAIIPMTRRVEKVLELGRQEAKEHRSTHVRGEHLLLGLAREGEGVGARILAELGTGYGPLRRRVDRAALACSFCGRTGIDVDHLVAGPGVWICERCVEDAAGPAVERQDAGCSFCGRKRPDVGRLFSGSPSGPSICDQCLALCREIQEEERRG